MAKQTSNGALGEFIGRLGPVVGYRWKNIWCLRTQSDNVRNPRTEAQQEHRSMFKQEVQLAGRMRWAVNIGLKEMADEMDMTPQNLFVKANQQAFSMVDGRLSVDCPNLCISAGSVAPVEITSATRDEVNVLTVNFEPNPLQMRAYQYDNVYFWVWCPEANTGYLVNPVYRRIKKMSVLLPSKMEGKEIHIYAFVQDEKGHCSTTAYGQETSTDAEPAEPVEGETTGNPPESVVTNPSETSEPLPVTAHDQPPGGPPQ